MAHPRWTFILGALWLAMAMPVSAGWVPVGAPLEPLVQLRLDSGRPELLYAHVYLSGTLQAYLWRSEDAGATWHNLQSGLLRRSNVLGIDPANPKVIWVWTTQNELWRSDDGGDTWSWRFTDSPDESDPYRTTQLLADPRDPDTIFRVEAYISYRVSVSHDGGVSFRKGAVVPRSYAGGEVSFHAERGELVAFSDRGLEVSTDGGQTWSVRGRYRSRRFELGRIAPSDPDTMYAVPTDDSALPISSACVVRSDDAGAHWRPLAFPRLPRNHWGCEDLAIDPKDARHVWVSAAAYTQTSSRPLIFESRDGGETWSSGLRVPTEGGVVAAGGKVLYTGGSFPGKGLHVSEDGGRTWKRRDEGLLASSQSSFVAQRLPDGRAGRRLVTGSHRSDGGKEWVKLPLALSSLADAGGSVLVATDAERDSLRRSRNGGETWRSVPSAPPKVLSLFADLAQPRYLALQTFKDEDTLGDTGFWTSDDGGATWRLSKVTGCAHIASFDYCLDSNAYAVDPFDPTRRWMAGLAELFSLPVLFISRDAGVSWQAVASAPTGVSTLAADPRVKDRILAATRDGLFVSEDGGEHWRPLGQGLPNGAAIRQFAWDERSATWYAATTSHGIYRSLDGGSNWQLLEGAPDLEAPTIEVDPRRPGALLALFRGQGVWRWMP
ncbi:MAG TPA: hypothetical protein VJ725_31875 [Thermoanaerobaculia bacterium]|nr:hypothetical protein [Thermoanaerobaculia bacterium]